MATFPPPRGWPRARPVLPSACHCPRQGSAVRGSLPENDSRPAGRPRKATHEIALLKEELALKDARRSRLSPRRRPHYTPVERMRILQLRAARGWSCEQRAEAMMLDEQTLKPWMRRIDEGGESALVRITEPVNRFPDFVRYLVRQLKILCPEMGNVRIAQVLARAGFHLGSTTVARMLKETEPLPAPSVS